LLNERPSRFVVINEFGKGSHIFFRANGSHHPARAGETTMLKTADRVLGVHGFVRQLHLGVTNLALQRQRESCAKC
jgi:hypothetical protein